MPTVWLSNYGAELLKTRARPIPDHVSRISMRERVYIDLRAQKNSAGSHNYSGVDLSLYGVRHNHIAVSRCETPQFNLN